MKKLLSLLAASAFVFSMGAAQAADDAKPAKPLTAQQEKMKTCNADAKGKTGDDRKKFMSECLSAKPAPVATGTPQQEKMKTCNADAKGKTGDDRKKFMSDCLKKK